MKSKKKMLLALGAMSVAAIGAGSVSTFAWFNAQAAASVSSTHTEDDNVFVQHTQYSIGNMVIGLQVIASDANQSNLVLAHYNSTEGGSNPKLTTGYLDSNSGWHDLGYVTQAMKDADNSLTVGAPNIAGLPSTSILNSTLTITVKIDYAYSEGGAAWHNAGTNESPNYDYYTDASGNSYPAATIQTMLAAAYIKLGITTDANQRIRFFSTGANATETSSNWYCDISGEGATYTVSTTTYVKIVDNFLLSEFTLASGKTVGTINYYVYGGATNNNDTASLSDSKLTFNPSFNIQSSQAAS